MLYFAYGSNLLEERLKFHVPTARLVGVGELAGWQRVFHLRSQDGSAKCDLIRTVTDDAPVQGAVYELDQPGRNALDQWEGLGGMYRLEVSLARSNADSWEVFFYAGMETHIDPGLRPYDWYLASVLAGARRLGLSTSTIAQLELETTWTDPDTRRSARNWNLIPNALR